MSGEYLIEIRIRGDIRDLSKKLIYDIFHKFRVRNVASKRPVPHISLFGPFDCRNIRPVIHAIKKTGSDYSRLEYQVNGFDYFELKKKFLFITTSTKKNVLYLKIEPSEELKKFRYSLSKRLLKITKSINVDNDSKKDFKFHATIAMRDIDRKFDRIWDYLKKYKIHKRGTSYRITLLRKGRIVCEYDLYEQRFLRRRQALGRRRR
ncbi:MAG: 2'-5' RNA ligase family protein [Thaumarchaeota archaeon]|nr:2'-5' RNA ligase family protein [Nitrososphaerota archaeon]